MAEHRLIEVRGYKWPRRPQAMTVARVLGEDAFGRWIGVAKGDRWWAADGSRWGVFEAPLVKVIPHGTFWSACFYPGDPEVDVDIVLPVEWGDDGIEEVDLELDVLRRADSSVYVRDHDELERVRQEWGMDGKIVAQAEATCELVRGLVERRAEPFGEIGRGWLARFMAEVEGV